ncbi:hypothetical protein WMY93_029698 [Mugilogobius chulae]|uniref:BTB domain-containing protein n=1 Tax=Mugilogobius chulae TaxID=88201 RepID=A0AAW0MPR7_9GOBI
MLGWRRGTAARQLIRQEKENTKRPKSKSAMFMSGLSESKQTHVHLRNVDPVTLQIIITYAYTGNLAISDSTVEPLYETACFLQMADIQSFLLSPKLP